MYSWPGKIVIVLVLTTFTSAGYGKSSKELIGDLQAAIKEEMSISKPGKDRNNEEYGGPMLLQLAGQLDSFIVQNNYEAPRILSQINAASHSGKVQQICKELSEQLRNEREQKESEFLSEADAAVKRAGEAAVKAKSEKDLDVVLQDLGRLRADRNEQMSDLSRRAAAKLEATVQFTTRWQDYLAQMSADNLKAAREILRNLAESSSYPVAPRSEILSRMQAISEAETKAKAIPGSLIPAKVETICAAVKNPAEISPALDQLTKLHQQFPSDVDNSILSELDNLNILNKQIQAGLTTPINLLDNAHRFIELRLQLILLALPQYLGVADNVRPQPNETVGQFLDRVIADAKKAENWPVLLKAVEASRSITRPSGGFGAVWNTTSNSLRSFAVGQNQERAEQYASAVVSYQDALKDTENLVPLDLVHDRLAAIKKDHPTEFEEGMQRVLNPPVPAPAPYRYPPNYPPGRRGLPSTAAPSATPLPTATPTPSGTPPIPPSPAKAPSASPQPSAP